MEYSEIHLKVLLPFGLFLERDGVLRVNVETLGGYYGILPNRLDSAAALPPGILMYETLQEGKAYLAVDEGILVKSANTVSVSVRNAVGPAGLGRLHEALEREFFRLDEKEKNTRTIIARLESGIVRQFEKIQKN